MSAFRAAHGGCWSSDCPVSMDFGRSVKLYHLLCAEVVSALREALRAVGTQAPNVVLQAFGDVSVRPGWARKRVVHLCSVSSFAWWLFFRSTLEFRGWGLFFQAFLLHWGISDV